MCVCVGGGGGGTIDPCPRPAPAGVWGSGCKLPLGKSTLHCNFDINPYFNKSKSVWKRLCLQYMYTDKAHYIEV